MQNFRDFMEYMRPHWPAVALMFTWTGICIVAIQRRLRWKRKSFLTLVNFSLNYRVGKSLAMRTLVERDADEVWLNEYGVKLVFAEAARATEENPFLAFKNPKDQDFVNRAVLNVLSSRFAEVFIASSLGVPVRSATYYFAVTCEKFTIMRTIKLRVLLMDEQSMVEMFGPKGTAQLLDVRNPIYEKRLISLRGMYDLYLKDKTSTNPTLGKVELGVVLGCPSVLDGTDGNPFPCTTSSAPTA
jgi:hypothetical protein